MTIEVTVKRIPSGVAHDDQKWFVIEGSCVQYPAATKRESISVAALASGDIVLADRVAKMRADVTEYVGNIQVLEGLPENL
jgi:hypothetical protein